MTDIPLNHLTALEASHRIAAGDLTSEALVEACLARIAARESTVHAWAFVDPERALGQARARDREPSRGPLHGIPIGIKDVIDTVDMPTQMGSPMYLGHQPKADAGCVAQLRSAGAVILGKTVTAEFAGMTPGPTANPHNPSRTPGGSSSGSAAAVADFMVPLALGTQTGGSVLRPSSYCGLFGYKPTFGTIARSGLKFAAESLDTIGILARNLDDMAMVTDALAQAEPEIGLIAAGPPRIGLVRTHLWKDAEQSSREAVENAAADMARAGAKVEELPWPVDFAELTRIHGIINDVERARSLAHEWHHDRARISEGLTRTVERGLAIPYSEYAHALQFAAHCRDQLSRVFANVDALLAPSANGEAPQGLHYTGDPNTQGFWTLLHVPALTLPTHRGPNNLPIGIQLVGNRYDDKRLFQVARWIWAHLGKA